MIYIVPATEDLVFQIFYVIKLSVVLGYITDKDSPQVLYRIEVWKIRRPWKNINIVLKEPGVRIAGSVSASVILLEDPILWRKFLHERK